MYFLNKKFLIIVLFIVIVVLLFSARVFHWESPRDKELEKRSDEIVKKIEVFRTEYGILPENLREIGLPESEEGPLYYNKRKNGESYTISFSGSALGESTYYDSEDGTWHSF